MLGDIKNPRLILIKGFLFLFLGLLASGILLAQDFSWKILALLLIAIWAFCRFYYFVFYVIEHYVDDSYRFSGLLSFLRYLTQRRADPQSTKNPGSYERDHTSDSE